MPSSKRLYLFFLLVALSGCGPSQREAEADRRVRELQAQNTALEKQLEALLHASKIAEYKLQELQENLSAQTEQNKKLEQARLADTESQAQKRNQEALAAFLKIVTATQVGINRHDYGLLLIETKTSYEASRPSLPRTMQKHLDSALEHLLSANIKWGFSSLDQYALKDLLSEDWAIAQKEIEAAKNNKKP